MAEKDEGPLAAAAKAEQAGGVAGSKTTSTGVKPASSLTGTAKTATAAPAAPAPANLPKGVEVRPAGAENDDTGASEPVTAPTVEKEEEVIASTDSRLRLTEEKLATMSNAEIRAVAGDRGYTVGTSGKRGLITAFLKAQGSSGEDLVDIKKSED